MFLFTLLPPVLAHGGLATNDMAAAAFLGATVLALLVWLERPTWLTSGLLGVCGGLAVLSRFSVLAFFPVAAVVMLAWRLWTARPKVARLAGDALRLLLPLVVALLVAGLVVWAGYRFSFGKVHFADLRLPAPELYRGIQAVMEHNAKGHPSYLLGQRSEFGFWYYYPVVLAVKTPLAFLVLLALGVWACLRKRRESRCRMPLAFSLGILLVAVFSNINIGVRHILAVYIGFSIAAALAAGELLERSRRSQWRAWALGVLALWLAGSSALAHPDYLAYLNQLAGDEPEKVLADSDLDWGQDMKRLGRRLREVGAREVTFDPFIVAHLERVHGFPPIRQGNPFAPSPGWNAVSLTMWKVTRLGLFREQPGARLWPDSFKPTERVGQGTLLYYIPPAQ
jgi:4-amino-4-deoxy-L-arabinose transferase-like glycosyltransferase